VVLCHLVLFGFVYPTERHLIPEDLFRSLLDRAVTEQSEPRNGNPICHGTLLSRAQYLVDVERLGFADARVEDRQSMTPRQVEEWTNAIDHEAR
jgi:hypothetical protein